MKVYQPRITVTLVKVIGRKDLGSAKQGPAKRFGALTSKTIDLTPYLGEMGSVHVSKGVSEPAGAFSISFGDEPHSEYLESLYGVIEPMDLVEIRMAREPHKFAAKKKLPIVMRGFVSDVRREQAMGPDGRPFRRVTVAGQDYGKILQLLQIIYINNAVVGDNIIHAFPFIEKYKIDTSNNPDVQTFVEQIVSEMVQKFVDQMPWSKTSLDIARPFAKLVPLVSAEGKICSQLVNAWPGGGPLYALLSLACDVSTGWNELFVHDREDDVAIVLRPTPFIRADGSLIPPADQGWFAPEASISDADIVAISATRADDEIANFFWVRHARWPLISDEAMRLLSQPLPVGDHPNCDPTLYGIRMLDTSLNLGAPGEFVGDGPRRDVMVKHDEVELAWQKSRLEILKEASWDSVIFERGMMRLKGNENVRAGMFLKVTMGKLTHRVYVTRVDHEFAPFGGFYTAIQYDRGTGFIVRAGTEKAPFYREMNTEGAYRKDV